MTTPEDREHFLRISFLPLHSPKHGPSSVIANQVAPFAGSSHAQVVTAVLLEKKSPAINKQNDNNNIVIAFVNIKH